jgi:hypothetical protein
MKIGDKIHALTKNYEILKEISTVNRRNANVYLCIDENRKKYIAKHFYKQSPMSNISYGKKNHYGRRRDGSKLVFNEIHEKSQSYEFIINHESRIKHNKKWVIILEFIKGVTLNIFFEKHKSDINLLSDAVIALAETLSIWHSNGFAHGDPHFDNCIIQKTGETKLKIYLIDYSQLHHKDFYYCKKYGCFTPDNLKRITEDLINPSDKFGPGFKAEIIKVEQKLNLGIQLSELFDRHYQLSLNCYS